MSLCSRSLRTVRPAHDEKDLGVASEVLGTQHGDTSTQKGTLYMSLVAWLLVTARFPQDSLDVEETVP